MFQSYLQLVPQCLNPPETLRDEVKREKMVVFPDYLRLVGP